MAKMEAAEDAVEEEEEERKECDCGRVRSGKSRLWMQRLFVILSVGFIAIGVGSAVNLRASLGETPGGLGLQLLWNSSKGFREFLLGSGLHFGENGKDASANCACEHLKNLTGVVEDCCCDYQIVKKLNHEVLHGLLQQIVRTPFFRYYKVKLWCDCPFWPEDGMCRLRDCSICECPENEFPQAFKKSSRGNNLGLDDSNCQEGKPVAAVDRTLDRRVFLGWTESDNPWTADDETDDEGVSYVNLLLNPERYTGYTGPSARRIWEAVYKENCFEDQERHVCKEARLLFRLTSGLHTSISVHIAADYMLDEVAGLWGPNPALLYERVLQYPERVQNLYFTYLFVLRAVMKMADYLSQAEYSTGNEMDDGRTVQLMKELVHNQRLNAACPLPFDEGQLWRGADGFELKQQTQKHFYNISSLMDCVGCEKCRLWGKLQISGLGTALKILFSFDSDVEPSSMHSLDLQRNEVISLINLLSRLSESLEYVYDLAPLITQEAVESRKKLQMATF